MKKNHVSLGNILFNVILPSIILIKGTPFFGQAGAFGLALLFPISYGAFDFYQSRSWNFFSILGFINVLLTGVIGFFHFSAKWIAVKEALIPFLFGVFVLLLAKSEYAPVRFFVYSDLVFNVDRIEASLKTKEQNTFLEKILYRSSFFLAGIFFLSAILNYLLAKYLITAETGSAAFNEQLGEMTALSYVVIALPTTLCMMALVGYVIFSLKKITGLSLMEILISPEKKQENNHSKHLS